MRGQVSFEAVLVFGVAIIVLVSLFNLNWERFYMARDIGEAGEAKMIGELLATSINNVYANGEGFSIYLGPDVLNYTKLRSVATIGGVGLESIKINTTARKIVLSKNMSKTGGGIWTTTVPIVPEKITRIDPTPQYNETTILNNGTYVIIYANQENIDII